MGNNRSRLTLMPLRSSIYGLQGLGGAASLPATWEAIADLKRGDDTGGVLVRHKTTQLYALWTGVGSVESVPQHKIAPALLLAGIVEMDENPDRFAGVLHLAFKPQIA